MSFEAPVNNGDGTFAGRDRLDDTDLHDAGGDPADITINGGANGAAGDTLQLGTGADLSTLVYSNPEKTSGTVSLGRRQPADL
jgi:hypothetical protein